MEARTVRLGSLALFATMTLVLPPSCRADDEDTHGPQFQASNMELVAHVPTGTVAADIWVHRQFAYLGSRACGEGVSIVDARDPANARALGRIPADPHSRYEDVEVLTVETPLFRGDLLAAGVQPCSERGTKFGVHLWDVTDPANPVELSFFRTGQRGSVHELAARQVGERVFLYLAVPFSERYGEGGDFRIVDASDPRQPQQIADWGVYSRLKLNDADLRVLGSPVVYCHSVNVSEDGRYAFLSYWDAGFIGLDVTDPANLKFLFRRAYEWPDEGNAHSVFPAMSRNLLIAADEDYGIGGVQVEVNSPGQWWPAAQDLPFARLACSAEPAEGELVFVGDGCGPEGLPDLAGRIAALDGGRCSSDEKALAAQRAGAAGFLLAGTDTAGGVQPGRERVTIPGATIRQEDFNRLKDDRGLVRVSIRPAPDQTWGFIRIFDLADMTAPRQIGSFATENARRCPATNDGWYSVHNPVVVGDVAYFSWYSDGVRAVNITDPANPVEIGSFVVSVHSHGGAGPVAARQSSGRREHVEGAGEPATFVWGVFAADGLIYLSDEMTGLWIVRLTAATGTPRPVSAGSTGRR